jgi:two-component system sensor histidine kinase KdpD
VFRAQAIVLLPDAGGRLVAGDPGAGDPARDASEVAVGQWVFEHGRVAGQGTETLPGAAGLYVPLLGSRGTVGVLGLRSGDLRSLHAPERLHQLETFAGQPALAIERARLAEDAEQAHVRAETERLRNEAPSRPASRWPRSPGRRARSSGGEQLVRRPAAISRALREGGPKQSPRQNLRYARLEARSAGHARGMASVGEVVGAALGRFGGAGRPRRPRGSPPSAPHSHGRRPIEQVRDVIDNAIKYT